MEKNDWIGFWTSVAMHGLLLVLFFFITTKPQPVTAGFIEVEFGPLAQGRPVQRTEKEEPETDDPAQETEDQVTSPEQIPEEVTKPVDLPDQLDPVLEDEVIRTPETETIVPEQPDRTEEETTSSDPASAVQGSSGDGQPDGASGANTGDEGASNEEVKAAPFVLEGIDRTQIRAPLPGYVDKVNAVIQMRITVDPKGRITRIVPLRKGNPQLERSVMGALRRWQFNALAPSVPQENQTGTITFSFRLQ
jgi:protein TonB